MKTPASPPPAVSLAPQLYFQLVHTLTGLLPPPLDDSPAALRTRNLAAIAKVAALLPVNANETDLAAQCIAARAQSEDVMRLLRENADDIALTIRLNAQYTSMVRTALSVEARLMRLQAMRQKREATEGAADQDAWTRHVVQRCMLTVADPEFERQQASPAAAPGEPPAAAPGEPPAAAPGEAPAAAPGEAPVAVPGEALVAAPGEAPAAAPGDAPVAAPGDAPAAESEAAPAETPVAVPTLNGQQGFEESVSEYETISHDMAFETWMSEQIGSQGPGSPDETGVRKRILEAMAAALLAGRESSPNSRESSWKAR